MAVRPGYSGLMFGRRDRGISLNELRSPAPRSATNINSHPLSGGERSGYRRQCWRDERALGRFHTDRRVPTDRWRSSAALSGSLVVVAGRDRSDHGASRRRSCRASICSRTRSIGIVHTLSHEANAGNGVASRPDERVALPRGTYQYDRGSIPKRQWLDR